MISNLMTRCVGFPERVSSWLSASNLKVNRVQGEPSDETFHEPADGPTTIYEQGPDPDAKVNVGRLPRLCIQGFRIIMAAGRRDFIVSISLQTST